MLLGKAMWKQVFKSPVNKKLYPSAFNGIAWVSESSAFINYLSSTKADNLLIDDTEKDLKKKKARGNHFSNSKNYNDKGSTMFKSSLLYQTQSLARQVEHLQTTYI